MDIMKEAWFDVGSGGGGPHTGLSYQYKRSIKLANIGDIRKYINSVWWKYLTARTVKMKWPIGLTDPTADGECYDSTDPNAHWRPWLEENVGRQHWDWDWSLEWDQSGDHIAVKFRKGKVDLATQFVLKYHKEDT
jgi:hypothetical protein